jgi:GNAT superfamily N-acetyltransferase
MIPLRLRLAGHSELSGKSENSLLDPTLRGGGTWGRIYEHAVELCRGNGMKVVWGFTCARKVWAKSGFAVHDTLVQGLAVLNLLPALRVVWRSRRKLISRLALLLASPVALIRTAVALAVERGTGLAFTSELREPDDVPAMLGELRRAQPELVHLEYDRDYVEWRVANHPHFRYEQACAYRGKRLVAWALINATDRDNPAIVEFLFSEGRAARGLLAYVARLLRGRGAGVVVFFANSAAGPGAMLVTLARGLGFHVRAAANAFVVRDLSGDKSLERPERWLFSALWFEGYTL